MSNKESGSKLIQEFQGNREEYLEVKNELLKLRSQTREQKREIDYLRNRVPGLRELFIMVFRYISLRINSIFKSNQKPTDQTSVDVVEDNSQATFNSIKYQIKVNTSQVVKAKVVHAIPNFTTGGSQQLVVDLIENMPEYSHEVIIAHEPGPIGYEGVTINIFNMWDGKDTYASKIEKYLLEHKPDLLHVHFWARLEPIVEWEWYHVVFQIAFKHRIKVVQNCNNPTFPYFSSHILHNVFVSNYAQNTYGLDASQNMVIYPGSNFGMFKRTTPYEPGDCIGMVYRLEKDKLNELSIEPFIEAIKQRPQTKALIIGGGSWYDYYNKRVNEEGLSGNFEFTGYVSYEDLPSYYERISVFVAPVHKESFGQVTPFAMNMGIPVVGFDVGAISEIVDNNSLLAAPGDVSALSSLLVDLLNNRKQMLEVSKFNRIRAQENFSLETMIEAYRRVYSKIV